MDKEKIIKLLGDDKVANLSGLNHISDVMRLEAFRPDAKGEAQHVTIEVKDTPDYGAARYFCSVESDGKPAHGNSGDNLYAVITNVHWKDLD